MYELFTNSSFCYNRLNKLEKLINSLRENEEHSQTRSISLLIITAGMKMLQKIS